MRDAFSLKRTPVTAPLLQQYARRLLGQALGSQEADFRPGQWEAIEGLVRDNARMLVVQRTGWGKGVVYFITTRLLRDNGAGPTLLVSPLLSLMRNQLLAAARLGVRAETVNSSNTAEWEGIYTRLRAGEIDILIISPERLANDRFAEKVLPAISRRMGFFVVDEAHCISDWGHDFRPDYMRIARILQALPSNIPVLATTATANNRVVADVEAQLGRDVTVLRGPLVRESLRLQNIAIPAQAGRLAWLAENVPQMPGSGIIYALTIGDAQSVAGWLQSRGINARAYWGGQDSREREALENKLLNNQVKALVATTALGMGFDKPDLGFVVHYQRPGSVVHYYQQVGRAGRALPQAYGVLLSGSEDNDITEYFIRNAFPPEAHTGAVLAALGEAEEGMTSSMLEKEINLTRGQIEKVLKSLAVKSPSPVAKIESRWHATPIKYRPDRDKIEQITAMRRREQARMGDYIRSRLCLMQFLALELDDEDPAPCGKCAACLGRPLLPETYAAELAQVAVHYIRRGHYPIEPRKQCPEGALPSLGWTTFIPPALRPEEGRALSHWGDGGWGTLVRDGKQVDGRFGDELVQASVNLLKSRWQPSPAPLWVTCIPSERHRGLVADFSRRLAASLGLPFVECISKQRPTVPQKKMENSYRQASNLDAAFLVSTKLVHKDPVLLVDDIVDSRWTFTVAAALLRKAGSGPVFPLALANSSKSDNG